MADTTISVRINEELHQQMKLHDEINWSGVIRNTLIQKLEQLEKINKDLALKAAKSMDKLRQAHVFDGGKPSVEIIREWRDRRK